MAVKIAIDDSDGRAWRIQDKEGRENLPGLDITESLDKNENKIWIKKTSKRKGHYRKIKGGKSDKDVKSVPPEKKSEPKEKLLPGFEDWTLSHDFEDYNEINETLLWQDDEDGAIDIFKNMIVNIGGYPHYFIAEAWYDDCLESREYDVETNPLNIKESFEDIAHMETNLGNFDHAEYLPDSKIGQYGVSYVTRKVPLSLKDQFDESQYTEKSSTMKDMNIIDKMKVSFGNDIVNKYNEKLSSLDENGLKNEWKEITTNDEKYHRENIGEWGHRMTNCDGWATKILDLNKDTSKYSWEEEGDISRMGEEESWMKSVLLNQEYMKRRNPSGFIELYRGLGGESYDDANGKGIKDGDTFEIDIYNLSSWTEYSEIADGYAATDKKGIVAKVKVPIENVLWTTRILGETLHQWISTKTGIMDGRECVVFGGGPTQVEAHSIKEYDHALTAEEFTDRRNKIHRREGLI